MATVHGTATTPNTPGVLGESEKWNGVLGVSKGEGQAGVAGVNESGGNGLYGRGTGNGVWGHGFSGPNSVGVVGVSDHNDGVRGISSTVGKSGVAGFHMGERGQGLWGQSDKGTGVIGLSKTGVAVHGQSEASEGVRGESRNPHHGGVVGFSFAAGGHGVFGACDEGTGVIAVTKKGNALFAKADQGKAGHFQGDVEVTGRILNSDLQARVSQAISEATSAAQKVAGLQQKIADMQNQLDTAISNLTARVTQVQLNVTGLTAYSHSHTREDSALDAEMAVIAADKVNPAPSSLSTIDMDGQSLSYPEPPPVDVFSTE
ncbi:hypothetical protein ETD83_04255 [Actinomadura soli]|uniref:Uncharacterized protein n=1 Tax=Actinomadura soli TaxID=2508997 RepID=A0A5C4JI22_9ACTN|nr:hypothetical protein [Actinomadura soli]TMR06551.1 hypothetical protein ETD83_04255 [Actinomadura soli]